MHIYKLARCALLALQAWHAIQPIWQRYAVQVNMAVLPIKLLNTVVQHNPIN